MPSFLESVNYHYLGSSLAALAAASFFSTLCTSLRSTGDAGLPRLIQRDGRHTQRLRFWQGYWNLLCKTAWVFLTLGALASFILFYQALRLCPPWILAGGLFLLALLHMLIARIVPHVLAESYADRISLAALPLIGPLTLLMFIFVRPLQWIEDKLLLHALSASDEEDRPSPEDEIKTLIEETGEEELEEEEREIIRSVFEFGDTVTREIMTPRINISGLKDTLNVTECIQDVKESPHSRFPVYHESIDDVIGIVHVKDLLRLCADGPHETPIRRLIKKIQFVPETMPINDLMQLMKNTQSQLVLVVDEYGGTAGLVSMEDIIEELVGEIEDEYDPQEKEMQSRPDGSLIINARISVHELNEELGSGFPESDEYDSLGGYIFSALGYIPKAGDKLEANGYEMRIQSATHRQIRTVHLIPKDPE